MYGLLAYIVIIIVQGRFQNIAACGVVQGCPGVQISVKCLEIIGFSRGQIGPGIQHLGGRGGLLSVSQLGEPHVFLGLGQGYLSVCPKTL